MVLQFSKMQALGNDFVMLNGVSEKIEINQAIARKISDRHFGIGCDQILVAEKGDTTKYGFSIRIFNSDGSEVGQCGNGARCFARYLHDEGLTTDSEINVATITTSIQLRLNKDDSVSVSMGEPEFDPQKIPLLFNERLLDYSVSTEYGDIEFSSLSLGNPHCVIPVDDIEIADIECLGPLMENHQIFPEKANIGFSEHVSDQEIKLRVHERGAGETLGCGSGACAAVISGVLHGSLGSKVKVVLPGGSATVEWQGQNSQAVITSSVETVFRGEISI